MKKVFLNVFIFSCLMIMQSSAMEQLEDAIIKGDIAKVEKALSEVDNPNAFFATSLQNFDFFPLILATVGDPKVEIIEKILSDPRVKVNLQVSGGGFSLTIKKGFTALHNAVARGKLDFVNALLKHPKIQVSIQDEKGNTPLHLASEKGHVKIIEALLKVDGIEVNKVNQRSYTPLHLAIRNSNYEVIEFLLKAKGIDLNLATAKGNTPLHIIMKVTAPTDSAKRKKREDLIELLLKTPGIEINAINRDKKTPLDWTTNHFEKVLLTNSGAKTYKELQASLTLIQAVYIEDVALVKKLLKEEVDPNKFDDIGLNPFFRAIGKKNVDLVQAFLDEPRIKVNKPNKYGLTAAHVAVGTESSEIVKTVVSSPRIDVNIQNESGSALHMAVTIKDSKVIEELLKAPNIEVNIQHQETGITPLHAAIASKEMENLKQLLSHPKIDVNVQSKEGFAPLHVAGMLEDMEMVFKREYFKKLLAHTDIKVNIQDGKGNTPLHIVVLKNESELVKELLSSPKIDVSIKNKSKKTPSDLTQNPAIKSLLEAKKAQIIAEKQPSDDQPKTPDSELSSLKNILEQLKQKLTDLIGKLQVLGSS